MVNINLSLRKRDLFLISAILVFMVGIGFVVAYNSSYSGAVPGSRASIMGHTADEIDGAGGLTDCITVKSATAGYSLNVSCPSGYLATGGGMNIPAYSDNQATDSFGIGINSWHCEDNRFPVICNVRCCK